MFLSRNIQAILVFKNFQILEDFSIYPLKYLKSTVFIFTCLIKQKLRNCLAITLLIISYIFIII